MIVDLKMLPWRVAMDIAEYCIQHGIEMDKCEGILLVPVLADYDLDIPDKHWSFLLLKYMSRWTQC